jgi:hypothetical protein
MYRSISLKNTSNHHTAFWSASPSTDERRYSYIREGDNIHMPDHFFFTKHSVLIQWTKIFCTPLGSSSSIQLVSKVVVGKNDSPQWPSYFLYLLREQTGKFEKPTHSKRGETV